MENDQEAEVECGKCGVWGDRFYMKKVEVSDGLDSDGEEMSIEMYLCPHCAEPPED